MLQVAPDGTSSTQTLQSYSFQQTYTDGTCTGTGTVLAPAGLITDGQKGVLTASAPSRPGNCFGAPVPSSAPPLMMADVSPQGVSMYQIPVTEASNPYPMVLGSGGVGFLTDGGGIGSYYGTNPSLVAFNINSGQVLWTYFSAPGYQISILGATSNGGVAIDDTQVGVVQLDASGNTLQIAGGQFATNPYAQVPIPSYSWRGSWGISNSSGYSELALPLIIDPANEWAGPQGGPSQNGGPGALCGCEVQSVAFQLPPPPPSNPPAPKSTISNLRPPACLPPVPGSQSTFLILVGDPGLNTVDAAGHVHNHNVGNLFNLAAQTKLNDLQTQRHRVIACRIHNVQDFSNALTKNGLIDGGVIYFGHSGALYDRVSNLGYSNLFIGGDPDPTENLNATTLGTLSSSQLGSSATIFINGCNAGSGPPDGGSSIARLIAKKLQRTVFAYRLGMFFSQDPNDKHYDGTTAPNPPNALPIYMISEGTPPKPKAEPFEP